MCEYGIPIGFYVDCDSAVCASCAPSGFAGGDYSEWPGFEGWESPSAIFIDSEADNPTHCTKCEKVIRHDLTYDGSEYVWSAIAEYLSEPGSHSGEVMCAWWDAYKDTMSESDLRGMIDEVLEHRMGVENG